MSLTLRNPVGRDSSGRVVYSGTQTVGRVPSSGGGYTTGVTSTTVNGITVSVPGSVTGRSLTEQKQIEALEAERSRAAAEAARLEEIKKQEAVVASQKQQYAPGSVRPDFASSNIPFITTQQNVSVQRQPVNPSERYSSPIFNREVSGSEIIEGQRIARDTPPGLRPGASSVQPATVSVPTKEGERFRGAGVEAFTPKNTLIFPALVAGGTLLKLAETGQYAFKVVTFQTNPVTDAVSAVSSSVQGVRGALAESAIVGRPDLGLGLVNPVRFAQVVAVQPFRQDPVGVSSTVSSAYFAGKAGSFALRSAVVAGKEVFVRVGSKEVPSSKVFSDKVTAKSTDEAINKFVQASTPQGRIGVVTVSPGRLTGGVIGEGRKGGLPTPLEDPGTYVAPAGLANKQFLRFAQDSSSYNFNPAGLFDFNIPTVSRGTVAGVAIQPSAVLSQPGFGASRDFLRSQAGSDLAFITKRSMIGKGDIKPQLFVVRSDFESPIPKTVLRDGVKIRRTTSFKKGDLILEGGTKEIEAVIPPGTTFSYKASTFIGRIKGFDEFTVVDGRAVALRNIQFGDDVVSSGRLLIPDFSSKPVSGSSSLVVREASATGRSVIISEQQLARELSYLSTPRSKSVVFVPPSVSSPVPSVSGYSIQSPSLSVSMSPLSSSPVKSPVPSQSVSSSSPSSSPSSSIYRSVSPSMRPVSPSVVSPSPASRLSVSASPISPGSPLSPSPVINPGISLSPGISKSRPIVPGRSPPVGSITQLPPPVRPIPSRSSERQGEFEVIVGSKDNKFFFNLGRGGKELIEKGRSLVRSTAAASITVRRVTPGRETDADVQSLLGRGFSRSKRKRDTFVQDVSERISSSGEKAQIPGEARRINLIGKDFGRANRLQSKGFGLRDIRGLLKGGFNL